MAGIDKKLAVIYYSTVANEEIIDKDFGEFYLDLQKNNAFKKAGFSLVHFNVKDAIDLDAKLKSLIDDNHKEIYLHFSGHGQTEGIPFNDWVLDKLIFATMLDDPKIVFCFFSSCKSAKLADLVSKRKIPIVIGTSRDENVENNYAIAFQNAFYRNLADKKSFSLSFQQAIKDIVIKDNSEDKLMRGTLPGNMFESKGSKFQIIFPTEEEEEQLYLIYPNIVDQLQGISVEEENKILLTFSDHANLLKEFEAAFKKKGMDETVLLFSMTNDDLENMADTDFQKLKMYLPGIKVLFLIRASENFFIGKTGLLFDDSQLLELSPKFKMAGENREIVASVLGSTQYLKKELAKDAANIFEYEKFDKLFENGLFQQFVTEINVDFSLRKEHVWRLPCDPARMEVEAVVKTLIADKKLEGSYTKEEIEKIFADNDEEDLKILFDENEINFFKDILDPEATETEEKNFLHVFFGPKKHEKIINFLINWLYNWSYNGKKFRTPIIISDNSQKKDLNTNETLEAAIRTQKKQSDDSAKFGKLLVEIFESGQIIVCRINEKSPDLQLDIKKLLAKIEKAKSLYYMLQSAPPDLPTFFFFIHGDDFDASFTEPLPIMKLSDTTINKKGFITWISGVKKLDINFGLKFILLSKQLFDSEAGDQEGQDPTQVIESVCETFKIPRKQILHIS